MEKLNHKMSLIYQRAKIQVFLNICCINFGLKAEFRSSETYTL